MTRPNTIIDIDRFFLIAEKGECWPWVGPWVGGKGFPYGHMRIKGKMFKAHRLMYEYFYGVSPGELKVLHRCDNPKCVRPSHLFLGTQKDNVRDCIAKGRLPQCSR